MFYFDSNTTVPQHFFSEAYKINSATASIYANDGSIKTTMSDKRYITHYKI